MTSYNINGKTRLSKKINLNLVVKCFLYYNISLVVNIKDVKLIEQAQWWSVLLPHSKHVAGSIPGVTWSLLLRSLPFLPVSALALSVPTVFLSQYRTMHVRQT